MASEASSLRASLSQKFHDLSNNGAVVLLGTTFVWTGTIALTLMSPSRTVTNLLYVLPTAVLFVPNVDGHQKEKMGVAIAHALVHRNVPFLNPVEGFNPKIKSTGDIAVHAFMQAVADQSLKGQASDKLNLIYENISDLLHLGNVVCLVTSPFTDSSPWLRIAYTWSSLAPSTSSWYYNGTTMQPHDVDPKSKMSQQQSEFMSSLRDAMPKYMLGGAILTIIAYFAFYLDPEQKIVRDFAAADFFENYFLSGATIASVKILWQKYQAGELSRENLTAALRESLNPQFVLDAAQSVVTTMIGRTQQVIYGAANGIRRIGSMVGLVEAPASTPSPKKTA